MRMRFLYNRKPVIRTLAWISLSAVAGIALAQYLLPAAWCLPCAGALALLSIAGCFWKGGLRQRVWLIAIPMGIGLLWNVLYTAWFVNPAEALVGEERVIHGCVTAYMEDFGGYRRVTIRQTGEQAPKVKTLLYDYGHNLPDNLVPGDQIEATVKITSAFTVQGDLTDRFASDGIFMRASLREDAAVVGRSGMAVVYLPVRLCNRLLSTVKAAFPEDVLGLMEPILTGDRTALYEDSALYTDMKLSGIVHVVAISGMHVAMLCAFLCLLFGRYRTSVIGIPVLWIFAMMTGLHPSVVRAAFMQTVLLLAPLLKRDNDSITSLSTVLMLLLFANPYAMKSVGLQLTFGATAGLFLFSAKILEWFSADEARRTAKYSRLPKPVARGMEAVRRFCVTSIGATIGANVFTIPIVAWYFGYVSIYSVFTNLLVVPAITILFCGGYAVTAVSFLFPAFGRLLGGILAWAARYAIWVIHKIAALPHSAVYTTNPWIVIWLGFVYLLVFGTYIFRDKQQRFRPLVPICMGICTLCAVLFLEVFDQNREHSVNILDVGQGQCIAVFDGHTTVLVDCGGSGYGSAGDTAAAYLHGHGRDCVDALVLTHLHADHTNGIENLYNHVDIRRIFLPEHVDEEDTVLEVLLQLAEEHHTELYFIKEDTVMTVGNLTVPLYVSAGTAGSFANERGLFLLADFGDFEALITGDANTEMEQAFLVHEDLPDIELLVVGHHGSKYATCQQLLDRLQPEMAAISVGYNTYGHPTEEVLERLEAFGLALYRTDLDGTITIEAG